MFYSNHKAGGPINKVSSTNKPPNNKTEPCVATSASYNCSNSPPNATHLNNSYVKKPVMLSCTSPFAIQAPV